MFFILVLHRLKEDERISWEGVFFQCSKYFEEFNVETVITVMVCHVSMLCVNVQLTRQIPQ